MVQTAKTHNQPGLSDLEVNHVIDGRVESADGDGAIVKRSPRDGELLYAFGNKSVDADKAIVDRAVASARQAFEDGRWRGLSVHKRKAVLHKLADLVEAEADDFALFECLDVGKPIAHAQSRDVPRSVATLRAAANDADKVVNPSGADGANFTFQTRKPVGVVGGIIGWNFPLRLATSKVGPALAMGNSLVLKASEFTALSASRLGQLALEAGVPPGVLNVVQGRGATIGAAISAHPDVDLISFVGSSATGKEIMAAAGQSNMKRLILECGGKSPFLIFEDGPEDLDALADKVIAAAFTNQGAVCVAATRLLVQASIKDALLERVVAKTKKINPGDPLEPDTEFGALIHEAHMHKVLGAINQGKEEGATLIAGGVQIHENTGGYYVTPAIFDHVPPEGSLAQEEIFGPVLSVFSFKDEDEAVELANNTDYGLAAYAATRDLGRAHRLGQRLNAGFIQIFGASSTFAGGISLSVEGQKASGFGHEGGLAGLREYAVSSTVLMMM